MYDYIDLINFEDEQDLLYKIKELANLNKVVSIIGDVYLIEFLFHSLLFDEGCDVAKIDFEANSTDTTYILMLNDNCVSILPIEDSDNDLLKLSDKVYVGIDSVNARLMKDCINSSDNVVSFAIGADIFN